MFWKAREDKSELKQWVIEPDSDTTVHILSSTWVVITLGHT